MVNHFRMTLMVFVEELNIVHIRFVMMINYYIDVLFILILDLILTFGMILK